MREWQNIGIAPFAPLIPIDKQQVCILDQTSQGLQLGILKWNSRTCIELLHHGDINIIEQVNWVSLSALTNLPVGDESLRQAFITLPSVLKGLDRATRHKIIENLLACRGSGDLLIVSVHQPRRWSGYAHKLSRFIHGIQPSAKTWNWTGKLPSGNFQIVSTDKQAQRRETQDVARRSPERLSPLKRVLAALNLLIWMQEDYLIVVPG